METVYLVIIVIMVILYIVLPNQSEIIKERDDSIDYAYQVIGNQDYLIEQLNDKIEKLEDAKERLEDRIDEIVGEKNILTYEKCELYDKIEELEKKIPKDEVVVEKKLDKVWKYNQYLN